MTSKIEWLKDPISGKPGYTINPVKGLCLVACPYCYARRMYKRFHWDETIRYIAPQFWIQDILKINNPSRIFLGSTMELFGDWIPDLYMKGIVYVIKQFPQHTFILLTKRPENLRKFSPFPENAWVGVSTTDCSTFADSCWQLKPIKAGIKFLSLEPLLNFEKLPEILTQSDFLYWWMRESGISWVIIGQQTPVNAKTVPKLAWIQEIVEAADRAGVPIFLKNNLGKLIPYEWEANYCLRNPDESLRQDFPKA